MGMRLFSRLCWKCKGSGKLGSDLESCYICDGKGRRRVLSNVKLKDDKSLETDQERALRLATTG